MDNHQDNISTSLHIAGPILTSMHFDMLNQEEGEIEGFLFGQVQTRTMNQISDHTRDTSSQQETRIIISGHVIIPSTASSTTIIPQKRFYSKSGKLDYKILNTSLNNDQKHSLLGYLRFRRNTRVEVSIRESAIYDSLRKRPISAPTERPLLDHQLICIVTATPNETSTLTLDFAFFTKSYMDSKFHKLPLVIENLLESTQAQYLAFASTMLAQSPLNKTLDSLSPLNYVQDYINVYKTSISLLKEAAIELTRSEVELNRLKTQHKSSQIHLNDSDQSNGSVITDTGIPVIARMPTPPPPPRKISSDTGTNFTNEESNRMK